MQRENRLVVANAAWGETIPEWLKEEIAEERVTLGMLDALKPSREVGDAEACAYLYTASLTAPMPHELNEIYIWLTGKVLKRRGEKVPDFAAQKLAEGLSEWEERELARIRRELWTRRGGNVSHPLLDAMRELGKGQKCPPAPDLKEAVA